MNKGQVFTELTIAEHDMLRGDETVRAKKEESGANGTLILAADADNSQGVEVDAECGCHWREPRSQTALRVRSRLSAERRN